MSETLVTGATGMIGFNIVKLLLERGRKVKALVRSLEKGKRLLPSECVLVRGDVTDKSSLLDVFDGCDVIYHCAGFPEQWMKNNKTFDIINVGGTQNMTEVALEKEVTKFIYTSTIDVFKAGAGESFNETIIDNMPKGTYYERSKQEADKLVVEAMKKGLPAVFLHPAGLYGPGPSDSPGVNDFIVKLNQGKAPVLLPGGFPMVFAGDVAEGHILAEEKALVGDRFILSDRYLDLTEVASKALKELGLNKKTPPVLPLFIAGIVSTLGEFVADLINKPPLIPKGQLLFMQWRANPDSTRAKEQLGWNPLGFEEGLTKTVSFLRSKNRL